MVFLRIIVSFLEQTVFTFGSIILFGWLIARCRTKIFSNFGNQSGIVCYVTGALGTPVHELGHALFCVIFGHKITKMKLFQIKSEDGTMGYVCHTYNHKNVYQKAGNFFIGIGPILLISAVLFGLAELLIPELMTASINAFLNFDSANGIGGMAQTAAQWLYQLAASMASYRLWIFLILGSCFALHMTLSKPDIEHARTGLGLVLVAFGIVDIVLGIVSPTALAYFTKIMLIIEFFLNTFLILSLVVALFDVAFSYIYFSINKKTIKKQRKKAKKQSKKTKKQSKKAQKQSKKTKKPQRKTKKSGKTKETVSAQ